MASDGLRIEEVMAYLDAARRRLRERRTITQLDGFI
jgi:hypothetical protein